MQQTTRYVPYFNILLYCIHPIQRNSNDVHKSMYPWTSIKSCTILLVNRYGLPGLMVCRHYIMVVVNMMKAVTATAKIKDAPVARVAALVLTKALEQLTSVNAVDWDPPVHVIVMPPLTLLQVVPAVIKLGAQQKMTG